MIVFQSTLPRGERRKTSSDLLLDIKFQSTLPRGERPIAAYKLEDKVHFNPRSREGSD